MKSSIEAVEEITTLLDRLNSVIRSAFGAQQKERAEVEKEEPAVEAKEPAIEIPEESASVASNGEAKANKSALVREYLKKHGTDVRPKDVVEGIKREHGVEVNPSLVSLLRSKAAAGKGAKAKQAKAVSGSSLIRNYLEAHGLEVSNTEVVDFVKKQHGVVVRPTLVSSVRMNLKKSGHKVSKTKKVLIHKAKSGRGPTMPSVVIETLKKAGEEGLELSEVTKKVLKSGYVYKGEKGIAGLTQNVFQALHNLSKKIAHPGFKGNTPVVLHKKAPGQRFGRYRLNPKALKNRVA